MANFLSIFAVNIPLPHHHVMTPVLFFLGIVLIIFILFCLFACWVADPSLLLGEVGTGTRIYFSARKTWMTLVRPCSHLAFFQICQRLFYIIFLWSRAFLEKVTAAFLNASPSVFFCHTERWKKFNFQEESGRRQASFGQLPNHKRNIDTSLRRKLSTVKTRNNGRQITRESAGGAINSFNYRTCRDLQHV